jgi:hypothetical protein
MVSLLALAATFAIAPTAFGDTGYFSFVYSVPGVTATGELVGNEIGSTGSYLITTGSITTKSGYGTYTGVIDSNPADMSAQDADNVLYFNPETASGRYLDDLGLVFFMNYGYFNEIWAGNGTGDGPGYSIWFWDDADVSSYGTFAVSAPDGGMTIMLLGGALVGLETLRRRFRV